MTILENVFKSKFQAVNLFPHRETAINKLKLSNFTHRPVMLILSFREYNNFGMRKFTL
jgi:hypothetical protein